MGLENENKHFDYEEYVWKTSRKFSELQDFERISLHLPLLQTQPKQLHVKNVLNANLSLATYTSDKGSKTQVKEI